MFLPKGQSEADAEKLAEIARKEAFVRVEAWGMELVPAQIRQSVQISVQEVQCGDPDCAPIDTSVTIIFQRSVHSRFDYIRAGHGGISTT
eukprot:scaffold36555_cov51-Attheya_sp.AAC.12